MADDHRLEKCYNPTSEMSSDFDEILRTKLL